MEDVIVRKLDQTFLGDLNSGILSPCLEEVRNNKDLILEIRGNYLNIYYRGGNVFKVNPVGKESSRYYKFSWDINYIKTPEKYGVTKNQIKSVLSKVTSLEECKICVEHMKIIFNIMNDYFVKHPKAEKFIQQEIVTSNALSNYLLTDFEYQKGNKARFDLMGLKTCESTTQLSFIELKQGYKSLKTINNNGKKSSGFKKHLQDILLEIKCADDIKKEISQARLLFKQKQVLGIIPNQKMPSNISTEKIEVLFVLANFMTRGSKKYSSYLHDEVEEIKHFLKGQDLNFKLNVNMMFVETEKEGYSVVRKSEIKKYEDWKSLLEDFYGSDISEAQNYQREKGGQKEST